MHNIRISRISYPRANGSSLLLLTAWIAVLAVAIGTL